MIAVLGAGSWGTALAITLARNTREVLCWGRRDVSAMNSSHENARYLPGITLPSNIKFSSSLEEVVKSSCDLVIAVPSHAARELITKIKPFYNQQRIVIASKGMDSSGKFLDRVISEHLSVKKLAVLAGPSFAIEVAKSIPTAVVIAAQDKTFQQDLVKYFHADVFRVYSCDDIIGVQLGGIFKNILAVAAGIADGMEFGANTRAALITRGVAELLRFAFAVGAKVKTLTGLSGVGDIVLSCTDDKSRNRRFGLLLAKGLDATTAKQQIGQVVEADKNVTLFYELGMQHKISMPIVTSVYNIINEKQTVKDAVAQLLAREPGQE